MKNQITKTVLTAFVMLLCGTLAFAQMPGGPGPGPGGHHPGHHHHGFPGGPGGPGGPGHPTMTCNAHFVTHRDSVANGVRFNTFPGSGAATFAWDFGDGSTDNTQNPSHVYADTGWYYVCLTVTDTVGGGCTDTWCDSIHVFNPPPHCNAHFGVRGDTLANTLNFNHGPSSPGATYAWDFGDGSTSTDPNATHTYSAAGDYYVCLTVSNTNAGGTCTDTWCDSVNTSMPPCPGHGGPWHHREASTTGSLNTADAVVSVYPNPMIESTTIHLENTSGNATLRVYGVSGQIVLTKQLINGDNTITRDNLNAGMYFYSVEDNDASIAKGKLRVN
jgi:PKD repeat protein